MADVTGRCRACQRVADRAGYDTACLEFAAATYMRALRAWAAHVARLLADEGRFGVTPYAHTCLISALFLLLLFPLRCSPPCLSLQHSATATGGRTPGATCY